MKNAIDLRNSTRAGRFARTAALIALALGLALNLAVIVRDQFMEPPVPTESAAPARNGTLKAGPFQHRPVDARV